MISMQRRCIERTQSLLRASLPTNKRTDSCLTNTVTGGSSRSAGWKNIPGDANLSARHGVGGSEVGLGDWCNTKGRRKWRRFFPLKGQKGELRRKHSRRLRQSLAPAPLWCNSGRLCKAFFFILLFPSTFIACGCPTLTCISFIAL